MFALTPPTIAGCARCQPDDDVPLQAVLSIGDAGAMRVTALWCPKCRTETQLGTAAIVMPDRLMKQQRLTLSVPERKQAPLEGDGIVPSPPTVKGDRHGYQDEEGDQGGRREEAEAQGRVEPTQRQAVGEDATASKPRAGNGAGRLV